MHLGRIRALLISEGAPASLLSNSPASCGLTTRLLRRALSGRPFKRASLPQPLCPATSLVGGPSECSGVKNTQRAHEGGPLTGKTLEGAPLLLRGGSLRTRGLLEGLVGAPRCLSTSAQSKKVRLLIQRAKEGHVEYMRQLGSPPVPPPPPYVPPSPPQGPPEEHAAAVRAAAAAAAAAAGAADPDKLLLSAERWAARDFRLPAAAAGSPPPLPDLSPMLQQQQQQQQQQQELNASERLLRGGPRGTPQLAGLLAHLNFPRFGCINAIHGDILSPLLGQQHQQQQQQQQQQEQQQQQQVDEGAAMSDCIVVPVPPNMIPYRGFGLEVLERGGEPLQLSLFRALKRRLQQKQQLPMPRAYLAKVATEERKQLQPGEVLFTPSFSLTNNAPLLAFLAMPYFFQGSSTEAARRLLHACRSCFKTLSSKGARSALLPFLGLGVYGFEPKRAAHIIVKAAIEEMLQLDPVSPCYSLSRFDLVDIDFRGASMLAEAVKEAESTWIPEKQVISAPQYWSRQTRRLLEVGNSLLTFCRRQTRVSFKKHHGVIRRQKKHYFSNIRPFMWRASRVLEPPPFMVLKHSGDAAEGQLSPRPLYLRGVSALLYPPRVSGFPCLRLKRDGQFEGINKLPKVVAKAKPRL
ncbi:hypothetical protein Esti_006618 [Eimeria stiedai]